MQKIELIIFDWDGTLIDSADRIAECMVRAAQDLGAPPPTREAVCKLIGLSISVVLERLYPGISSQDAVAFRDAYRRWYFSDEVAHGRIFDGVEELLGNLRENGHQLAVATGKSRVGLDHDLKRTGLGKYFHKTRTADESASKPDPLMLHQLLREFDVLRHNALMIGDTSHDLQMAANAGVPALAVSYGAHSHEELQAHEPTAICETVCAMHGHLLGTTHGQ